MVFIVPDILLENQCCSSCKKYLSVGPVKVYSNGRIKCGRCSEENDGGAISVYNKLMNEGLFRCIYRYEGCNEILSSSDMEDHEAQHETYLYKCPACADGSERTANELYSFFLGSAYMMRKHYNECHNNDILTKNELEIDLTTNYEREFLYTEKDFVFLINVIIASDLTFFIVCLRYAYVNVNYTLKIVSSKDYCQLYKKQHCVDEPVGPITLDLAHHTCILKFELELPENVLSFDQSKKFLSKKDADCVIEMSIDKLSSVLSDSEWFADSSEFLCYGLTFELSARFRFDPSCEFKYFSLELDVHNCIKNVTFSGRFHVTFLLLSVKPEINNFRRELYHVVDNKTFDTIEMPDFKPLHEILDPKNGFIKSNQIDVKVEITVLYLSCAPVAIST